MKNILLLFDTPHPDKNYNALAINIADEFVKQELCKYAVKYIVPVNSKHKDKPVRDYKGTINESVFNACTKLYIDHLLEDLKAYDSVILFSARVIKLIAGEPQPMETINKSTLVNGVKCIHAYAPAYVMRDFDTTIEKFQYSFSLAIEDVEERVVEIDVSYDYIDTIDKVIALCDYIDKFRGFTFDFETSSLNWWGEYDFATVLGISAHPGHKAIIPIDHEDSPWCCESEQIWAILIPRLFENPKIEKTAHNLWFDTGWLWKYGVRNFAGLWHCTLIMSKLLFRDREAGLKSLAALYFPESAGYQRNIKELLKIYTWGDMPMKYLAPYCAYDTQLTGKLKIQFESQLLQNVQQYYYYRSNSMQGMLALKRMSCYGNKIDKKRAKLELDKAYKASEEIHEQIMQDEAVLAYTEIRYTEWKKEQIQLRIEKLEARNYDNLTEALRINNYYSVNDSESLLLELNKLTSAYDRHAKRWLLELRGLEQDLPEIRQKFDKDVTINPTAPEQLEVILYDIKKLEPKLDMLTGDTVRSVERDFLLAFDDDFVQLVIAYKAIVKNANTYIRAFYELSDEEGFLHGDYNVVGTDTGRISSKRPSLQNIPWFTRSKNEAAINTLAVVRELFINKGDDYYFVQNDFSQMELRMIANWANDPVMQESYLKGIDLHTVTGAKVAGMELEEFIELGKDDTKPEYKFFKENRTIGKTGNFSLIYGMGTKAYIDYMFRTTGLLISEQTAKEHHDAFFETFPEIEPWHIGSRDYCSQYGYATTLFGRRRDLSHVFSSVRSLAAQALRQSINTPIQGTCGEWTIYAMALCDKIISPEHATFCNTIHDSLFAYVKKYLFTEVLASSKSLMQLPEFDYVYTEPINIVVPMKVDTEISELSWKDMKNETKFFN